MAKISKNWGLYRPNRKLAVRLIWQPTGLRPAGRPTANDHKYDRWGNSVDRPADRPDTESRALVPVDRRVDRPDTESKALWSSRPFGRPTHCASRRAQPCAHLSDTGPVDRPVDRTREPCSLYLGGRPGGRPDQRACSLYRAVDREVDRICPTVIFLTVGGRPPACQAARSA